MSYLTWKMRGLSAAFAVISTVGFVSNADAIISRKVWDPAYGSGLADLGWSGEVEFEIKPECLATVTGGSQWVYWGTANCDKVDSLGIKSATVTLYDLAGGTNTPEDDVKLSYSGGKNIFAGQNFDVVPRMYIEVSSSGDKSIKATQGLFLFPEITSAPFAKLADYDAAAFWLSFAGTETNDQLNVSPDAPLFDRAFLNSCSFDYPAWGEPVNAVGKLAATVRNRSCSSNDGLKYPANLQPVPEPETYLMALASFGVLGLWARRRRLTIR